MNIVGKFGQQGGVWEEEWDTEGLLVTWLNVYRNSFLPL